MLFDGLNLWKIDHPTSEYVMFCVIWYHFAQFKKREKHPSRSVTFSKVAVFYPATSLKVAPPWVFLTIFRLRKWYQFAQRITYRDCRIGDWCKYENIAGGYLDLTRSWKYLLYQFLCLFLLCYLLKRKVWLYRNNATCLTRWTKGITFD